MTRTQALESATQLALSLQETMVVLRLPSGEFLDLSLSGVLSRGELELSTVVACVDPLRGVTEAPSQRD